MLRFIHTVLQRISNRTAGKRWDKITSEIFQQSQAINHISFMITGETENLDVQNQSYLAQEFRWARTKQIQDRVTSAHEAIKQAEESSTDISSLNFHLLRLEDYLRMSQHSKPSEPRHTLTSHSSSLITDDQLLDNISSISEMIELNINQLIQPNPTSSTLIAHPINLHPELTVCSRKFQQDGWLLYPGIAFVKQTLLMYCNFLSGDKGKQKVDLWNLASRITTVKILADSFSHSHCRPTILQLGQLIIKDMMLIREKSQRIKQACLLRRTIHDNESTLIKQLGFRNSLIWENCDVRYTGHSKIPEGKTYVHVMAGSFSLSRFYTSIVFRHLILAEQKHMLEHWPKARLQQHCTSVDKVLLCNTRWRASVIENPSPLLLDPNSVNIAGLLPRQPCPVLDKNSPLYLSISMFVHSQLNLPVNKQSFLFQKHRGISQDLALSLQYAYAPGSLSTFRRVHESCCICRFRTRKYLRTREGDVHHSQLVFVKPYFSVHLDLLGPLYIKLHNTTATRANTNERKIWVLCVVCSFSKATWVEVMQGTSAADFSDALTRTMCVTGSIGHIVTDRLASQITVIKHGTFIEQIQSRLYKRMGWFFEAVPVSRHNANGLVENRIKGIRKMLSLDGSHTHMSLLEFITHSRLATSLINTIPFGYSLDAVHHPDLQVISPSSFLYPLGSMNRPVLSGVHMDRSNLTYFHTMRNAYENLIDTYADSVIPYLLKKHHKFDESIVEDQIGIDDIVMFKKRPNSNFLPGWSLGRVVKIRPSKDGVVRVVVIEYVNRIKKTSEEDLRGETGHDEAEDFEAAMKDMRKRVDKNSFKTQTTRQVDEIIRLHPISPSDNDIHSALQTILDHNKTQRLGLEMNVNYSYPPVFNSAA